MASMHVIPHRLTVSIILHQYHTVSQKFPFIILTKYRNLYYSQFLH